MSFVSAFFYDRFMARTEAACLAGWRRELLRRADGEVLEIGAGTGANIEHYPEQVSRLVLSEPDRHMRRILQRKADQAASGRIRITADSTFGSAASSPRISHGTVSTHCLTGVAGRTLSRRWAALAAMRLAGC